MQDKRLLEDLTDLFSRHYLDRKINTPSNIIASYVLDSISALAKVYKSKPDTAIEDEFVERMYALYPTKCPKRGVSLGKTHKDKDKIRKLLKTMTMDDIETVFRHEIEEKLGKHYMQNFSTFLNNFPDIDAINEPTLFGMEEEKDNSNDQLIVNGVIYR